MPDLRRFSHSLIDTFLDCPRKAFYRYVEGIPSPTSAALIRGSACDEAWNHNLQQKLESGTDLPEADVLEITEAAFRDRVAAEGGVDAFDWGDGNARASLDSALRLSRTWINELAPAIAPAAVQVEYHRTLPSGRDFVGFVDAEGVVEGLPVVLDNKTGSRRLSESEANKSLQPFAYAWLKGEPITFVFARSIDTGRNCHAEFVWTGRSAGDVAWYGELVETVERSFEAGIFPPNPKSNLCGPKWCPFYERCQPHRVTTGG